jgi:Spy/CpxP family protein refolding chaperone
VTSVPDNGDHHHRPERKIDMTKQTVAILTSIALIALLAGSVLAQQGSGRQGSRWHQSDGDTGAGVGFERRLDRLTDALDLSEAQREAIEKLHEANHEQMVTLRKEKARLRNQLEGELLADEPSEQTVVDLTQRIGDLGTQMQVLRARTRLAVRAELTDEQRDQLLLMGEGRRGRGGLHRSRAPHAPGDQPEPRRLHRRADCDRL